MTKFIDNLEDLKNSVKSCLVLYSGGLDSSWFLLWAKEHGIKTTAINIHIGQNEPSARVQKMAEELGATFHCLNLTSVFVDHFVSQAILANALYQGRYPISSSLSRPLTIEAIIKLIAEKSADCVVHTTTFLQNSAARFNNSLQILAPKVLIANPFINSRMLRSEKKKQLQDYGIEVPQGIYSIDENIWGRVIECGELSDPANVIPKHIWKLTADSQLPPPRRVKITFERGLPVALDGEAMNLTKLVRRLNIIAGSYCIGRYNGLEETIFGIKNHEVRESPAASVLLEAHAGLENAVLTGNEIRVKKFIDQEWTEIVVKGNWHSPLAEANMSLITSLNQLVNGDIIMSLQHGSAFISAVNSPQSIHFENLDESAMTAISEFSYKQFFEITRVPQKMRRQIWKPKVHI